NSAFDGNSPSINSADGAAIATDKLPLAAGNTASVKNYTSYSKGINGLMIDVQDLPTAPPLSDFVFRAGNTANVSTWAAAPAVLSYSVLPGAGVNGSNRIEFTWPDGAIRNEWLQVTVASDTATGLHTAEVFYFGNLVGSATGSTQSQSFVVTSLDVTSARSDPHTFLSPAPVTDSNDFNRDGRVDALDQLIARASTGATLLDLTAPPTPLTLSGSQATLAPQAPQPDSILRRRRAVGAAPLG
ncbi:MAG TPA: hypothetical protein VN541_12155, partial [Tepidisphaeraceae bacterium]|nr:hypothetical protein [Tepidisphaeraceae bacterium]